MTYKSLWHIFTSVYDWLCHLAAFFHGTKINYYKGGKANHTHLQNYAINYYMSFKELKVFLVK